MAHSLVTRLGRLMLPFAGVALVVARNLRIAVASDVVIAAGFAIFALSNFPPTQRFGLVVVSGTIIGILANLFLLPLLGGAERKQPQPRPAMQHANA